MNIFISYRRDDSCAIAGRIYDRLRARFGAAAVFFDVDTIPIGVDFREFVRAAISKADVQIALIGLGWRGDGNLTDRLTNADDPVRIEIESALGRPIPVIPVLLDNAEMPREENLPPSLAELSFRNALHIDAGKDFDMHIERLIQTLETLKANSKSDPRSWQRLLTLAGLGLAALATGAASVVLAAFILGYFPRGDDSNGADEQKSVAKAPTPEITDQERVAKDKPAAQEKSKPGNEPKGLELLVKAKQGEIRDLLITLTPGATGADIQVSSNGKEVEIRVLVKANNAINGRIISAEISTEGVEAISMRQGAEAIPIPEKTRIALKRAIDPLLNAPK